jgi:hypothetical protein
MKTNRRLSLPDDDKRIVKKIFLLTCAGTLALCAVSVSPHWTLRLVMSAVALLAMVYELGRSAPVGYEDETGFHYAGAPRPRRRARRTELAGSFLGSSRSPLKA